MAVVLMEGFDHLSATQFTVKGWSAAMQSVGAGRLGGQYGQLGGAGTFVTKTLPSTYSTLIAGFAFNSGVLAASSDFFAFRVGTTNACRLRLALNSGSYYITALNSGGSLLGTGTFPVIAGIWNYIEVKAVISATVGQVEVRVNGPTVDINTAANLNLGASNIDNVGISAISTNTTKFDDLYVADTSGSSPTNTWLGDVRVETLAPTGDGANTAWTGVYTAWDDSTSHNTDTDYVSSSTPGDRETSTLADLTGSGTVFAVQTNLVARKDDGGDRTIAPVIRISSTDYDGTTTSGLSTSYVDYTQLYERLDPSGAAWTTSTINAMEAGVKEVA